MANPNYFKRMLVLLLTVVSVQVYAQDMVHYKRVVKELSSAKYQGRGYARGGANKAGKFLRKEFAKAGADEVICQPFVLDINTFPGKMKLSVDGKKMIPGVDFTMREFAPGFRGTFPIYYIDTLNYNSEKIFSDLSLPENKDAFVVCDFMFSYKHGADFKRLQSKDGAPNAGIIFTWDEPLKFYKAYGERVGDKPVMWVPHRFPKDARTLTADIENKFLDDYECFNVIAKVEGRRHDSCYVFTLAVGCIMQGLMTMRQELPPSSPLPRIMRRTVPNTTCISLLSRVKMPICVDPSGMSTILSFRSGVSGIFLTST